MRKATFTVQQSGKRAEITVIDLAREAGDRLANVNRWRGQVGQPPLTASELASQLETLPVGPLTGDFVSIPPAASAERPQSILGVIVDHAEKTWFIKLQGDPELAAAERDALRAFAATLRFVSAER
jgi:hypothetical protein